MVLENLGNVFSKNRPIFTFAARISSPAFSLSTQKHTIVRNTISPIPHFRILFFFKQTTLKRNTSLEIEETTPHTIRTRSHSKSVEAGAAIGAGAAAAARGAAAGAAAIMSSSSSAAFLRLPRALRRPT